MRIPEVRFVRKDGIAHASSFIIETVMICLVLHGVAMLDFDELQQFPKMSSWATKSDFICDLMGTQNHQKTLYFP